MDSYAGFKFKVGDVIVPKEGIEVPDFMEEVKISQVRPAHYQYKGLDCEGDELAFSPKQLEEDFQLKGVGKNVR